MKVIFFYKKKNRLSSPEDLAAVIIKETGGREKEKHIKKGES